MAGMCAPRTCGAVFMYPVSEWVHAHVLAPSTLRLILCVQVAKVVRHALAPRQRTSCFSWAVRQATNWRSAVVHTTAIHTTRRTTAPVSPCLHQQRMTQCRRTCTRSTTPRTTPATAAHTMEAHTPRSPPRTCLRQRRMARLGAGASRGQQHAGEKKGR